MVNTDEIIEIDSRPYGKIKISAKQRINFEEGMYGFEKEKTFYLLDMENEGPFYYLQSAKSKELAFVLINPYMFKSDFILDVSKSDLNKIGIEKPEEAESKILVFAIVTIPENSQDMTANLLGPILINVETRQGVQALSLVEGYTTKHKILEELSRGSGQGGA